MKSNTRGFVYLDIVIALFLFGLGFAVVFGLVDTAYFKNSHTESYLNAVNLASSAMDEVLADLDDDPSAAAAYLKGEIKYKAALYDVFVNTEWYGADLLSITVEVDWMERGRSKNYRLNSLHHISKQSHMIFQMLLF